MLPVHDCEHSHRNSRRHYAMTRRIGRIARPAGMPADDEILAGLLHALEHSIELSDRLVDVVRQCLDAQRSGVSLDGPRGNQQHSAFMERRCCGIIWDDELALGVMDREHGTRRLPQDLFADTAPQHLRQQAVAA